MNRRIASVIAVAVVALASGTAIAQPGVEYQVVDAENPIPPPPPILVASTPPPQPIEPSQNLSNEPWGNVSHINGRVVEVGERGKYLKKTFTTNIASNPIGWLVGYFGISVSRSVHSNAAVRVDGTLFVDYLTNNNVTGYEVSANLPIYFRRVFSGPFLEPGLMIRTLDEIVGPQMMVGWHWTFDSGLNVAFAAGVAKNVVKKMYSAHGDHNDYDSDNDIAPAGYFRIGIAR